MSDTSPESSAELLHRYAGQGSEEAFRQLSAIHAGMVYATAERRLGALRHMAADVTQAVFILLARRARVLPQGIVISAWLHRQTVRQSLNFLRSEHRRQIREQSVFTMNELDRTNDAPAWQRAAPELDEALLRLPPREREVLMLRYFEDKTLAGVAGALGISEDAAQKRVARALEKLRRRLAGRGAAAGVASLAGWLTTNAVPAAPPGLIRLLPGPALAAGKVAPAGWMTAIVEAWRQYPLPALLSAATVLAIGGGLVLSRSAVTPGGRDREAGIVTASSGGSRIPSSATTGRDVRVLTLDEIVSALEREAAAPQNLRTQLRMDALIAQVRQADVPAFAELANERFSLAGKALVFPRILKTWAKHAPEAAMDFLVAKDLPNQTTGQTFEIMGWDVNRMGGIASDVYRPWLERDPAAAARWVATNLNAPALQHQTPYGTSTAAGYLAALTAEKLALNSVEDMVAFAVSLPEGPARKAAMAGVAGDMEKPDARSGWDSARWSAAAEAVAAAVQNGGLDSDVLRRFAGSWAIEFPEEYHAWLEKQPPGELQIHALLGPAMENPRRLTDSKSIEGLMRQWTGRSRRTTPAERLAIASAALDHVSPERVSPLLQYIAENWRHVQGSDKDLGEWIHRQAPGPEADAALIFTARSASNGAPQDGLALAEMVSDPLQRETLITGLLRRWHARDPEKARKWLAKCEWPAERLARITQRITNP